MERDAFPGFLRMKALGNLVPPSMMMRLIVGLLALFGGFWTAFVLIFLNESRTTRCWVGSFTYDLVLHWYQRIGYSPFHHRCLFTLFASVFAGSYLSTCWFERIHFLPFLAHQRTLHSQVTEQACHDGSCGYDPPQCCAIGPLHFGPW